MKRVLAKRKPHRHHTGGYNGSGGGYGYGPRAWATCNVGRHYGVGWRVVSLVRMEPVPRGAYVPHNGDRERARRVRQMDDGQLTGLGVTPPLPLF